jgi:hypothetical protein
MSAASSIRKFVKDQQRGSLAELKEASSNTLKQIRDIFSNISGLTGVSTPDAVQQYYDTASRYFEDALGRGREDVYGFEPRGISESASVMKGMIDPALDQYSLMNRGGFMSQALNPSVVEIDPSKIFGSLDYSTKGYSTANPLLDYRDAASQAMIQGRRGAIEQQADFYANNPNVKGLMTYNV